MTSLIESVRNIIAPTPPVFEINESVKIVDADHYMHGATGKVVSIGQNRNVTLDIDTTPYTITVQCGQLSPIDEAKVGPSKDSIARYISRYSLKDEPDEVAAEIGKEYGWNEKQIHRAEQIIRKHFIR